MMFACVQAYFSDGGSVVLSDDAQDMQRQLETLEPGMQIDTCHHMHAEVARISVHRQQ